MESASWPAETWKGGSHFQWSSGLPHRMQVSWKETKPKSFLWKQQSSGMKQA